MSARYSSRVGMRPSLEQTAASSALPKNTLVFLPKRLGKLRVLVLMTVAPSRTCAWLPMHRLQPGISVRAPAVPKTEYRPSSVSWSWSILVGGATQSLTGMSRLPSSSLAAARKCPMLVMQLPIKASSIGVPATSLMNLASSGSLGQQTMGSWMSARLMSITAAYWASASALSSAGFCSQFCMALMRRASVRASW